MSRKMKLCTALGTSGLVGAAAISAAAQHQSADVPDERRRSPVQRDTVDPPRIQPGQRGVIDPAVFPNEFRTIDGAFNNGNNPTWGAKGIPFLRLMEADYGDGVGTPAGADRPNPRAISSAVLAQQGMDILNPYQLSDFVWQWGQFLDHDIDETPIPGDEIFDIQVPKGDPFFDPKGTGSVTLPLTRSGFVMVDGVRQQVNNITSFIDASNVYGSEEARAEWLRTNDGTGTLKTSAGGLLPFNVDGLHNAPSDTDTSMFLAGDIRANEQSGLTAMHTLFMREHNRLAEEIAADNPSISGDEIYERARAFVAAEVQAISYNEFLPRLLGTSSIPDYTGYDETVNPTISNLFATSAYRVGHTMLSSQILRLDSQGNEIPAGHLDLADAFFKPETIENEGIAPLLRGLATQGAQDVDAFVIGDVRNFLFGPPGSGGLDLVSLNIQRGREHGIPSYNDMREAFGRNRAEDFSDINPDPDVHQKLNSAYDNVDQIDAWVGLLSEPHAQGAFVGETLRRIFTDQFVRLRDGDRFWYQSYLPQDMIDEVEDMTLAEVIRANTSIDGEIQDDVFLLNGGVCFGDCDGSGEVDFNDIVTMLSAFGTDASAECDADQSGEVDFNDLLVALFMFGECP